MRKNALARNLGDNDIIAIGIKLLAPDQVLCPFRAARLDPAGGTVDFPCTGAGDVINVVTQITTARRNGVVVVVAKHDCVCGLTVAGDTSTCARSWTYMALTPNATEPVLVSLGSSCVHGSPSADLADNMALVYMLTSLQIKEIRRL